MQTLSHRASILQCGFLVLGLSALAAPAGAQTFDPLYHLMRRMTPGFTPAEFDAAKALGFNAYVQQQITNYTALSDVEGQVATQWPDVFSTPKVLSDSYVGLTTMAERNARTAEIVAALKDARVWRWIESDQAMYERMTWFWANHFNVDVNKRGELVLPWFDSAVNRSYTFDMFEDMAHACAGDDGTTQGATALLYYLDNYLSNCAGGDEPNENFAREFMELYTIGPEGTYSEADVKNLARGFSGWTGKTPTGGMATSADFLMLQFNPSLHCAPSGNFLGGMLTLPFPSNFSSGQVMIDAVLDYQLANGDNATASFIARKLVAAFLTDGEITNATQQAAVDRAIQDAIAAYDAGGATGDIDGMLQAILTQANITDILNSGSTEPAFKYMPPWLYISSLLNAVDADVDITQVSEITARLDGMGQRVYEFGPPTGYPEDIVSWVDNQPGRWNFANDLFRPTPQGPIGAWPPPHSLIPGVNVNVVGLYNGIGGFDRPQCAAQAAYLLTGGTVNSSGVVTSHNMDAADVARIQAFANASGLGNGGVRWRVLVLTALAPSFSLY